MWTYLAVALILAGACIVFGLLRADLSEDAESEQCASGNCHGCSEHHRCGDDFSFHQPMTDPRELFKQRR